MTTWTKRWRQQISSCVGRALRHWPNWPRLDDLPYWCRSRTRTHDHQRRNAAVLAEAGAAEVIDERDMTGTTLGTRVVALTLDDTRRASLAAASQRFARPEAVGVIVDRIERLLASKKTGPAPESAERSR